MITDTMKAVAALAIAGIAGLLYLLSKKKPAPESTPESGGTGTDGGTGTGTETGSGSSGGSTEQSETKPRQTPDEYCKATYGTAAYYDATLNTCVKRKSATEAAAAAQVKTDSFNLWYADFLNRYGINPATVSALDVTSDGSIQVIYKDGSRKVFPNPAILKQIIITPGSRIIAPESSRQAAPINIDPPRNTEDQGAEKIAVREYLSHYPDWTHVTVNYGTNPSVYVYAQGLCNQYGLWYPNFEGLRDPVQAYNDAQVIPAKACPPGYHWDQATADRLRDQDAGCVPDGAAPSVIVQNDAKPQDMRGQSCEAYALTKGGRGSSEYNYAIADCRERGGWG